MPAPIDVCVETGDGALAAGRAVPSRAGIYDPATAIDPARLNWTVDGLGCVAYPSGDARRASCGDPPSERQVVARRLCAR